MSADCILLLSLTHGAYELKAVTVLNCLCKYVIMTCFAGEDDYMIVVRYASSLVDALLFIHYLAFVLLELRPLRSQFAIKLIRSPDGVSRTYTVGQLSVQRLASWCLDRYYRDFETYNPYLETVARRGSRRMKEFKVHDMLFIHSC